MIEQATLEAAGIVAALVMFVVGVLKANRVTLRGGATVAVAALLSLVLSALYVGAFREPSPPAATAWQIVSVTIMAWGGALGVSWGARLSAKRE